LITLALVVAASTLAVALLAGVAVQRLQTVRLQLAGLAALSVLLPLAAVFLSGWVMFHMGDDVKILAVAAVAATVAAAAGVMLANRIASSLDRVRLASLELARGDLTTRAPEGGPAEIAELGLSFNRMAESLEQLFDARRELIAWASHDLRTPIASIQAMLEALEDGLAEPDQYLPELREQVRTLARLVEDLFELSTIDTGTLTLELRHAELSPLVESCVRGVGPQAEARRVRLSSRIAGRPTAFCAPDKVERVLYNLLTNALRHTPSDGTVAVQVEPRANEVEVTVEDTGEGLTPEASQRMFERFWRGDRSRSGGGAGLGLAIARGLVEAQGGRIWAESRPEGGAAVRFTLPAA
jgi:signal transduction histidine kinase